MPENLKIIQREKFMADQISASSSDVIQPNSNQNQPIEQLQSTYVYSDLLIRMRKEAAQHRILRQLQQQQEQTNTENSQSASNTIHTIADIENQQQIPDSAQQNTQPFEQQQQAPQPLPRDERWFEFACVKSEGWPQRRWNIIINLLAAFLVGLNQAQNCGIPINMWITVQLLILASDSWLQEVRERLSNSYYWHTDHRKLRKAFVNLSILVSEMIQQIWFFKGAILYFSQDAKDCSKENGSMMVGMTIFLLLGLLKFIVIMFLVFLVFYVLIQRKLKRRKERNMSLQVINSLSRVKFQALLNQGDPDEECVICFNEYKEEDIVSRLDCNQKHMFHEECLRSWITQGKNSCPICRAPINSNVQL